MLNQTQIQNLTPQQIIYIISNLTNNQISNLYQALPPNQISIDLINLLHEFNNPPNF